VIAFKTAAALAVACLLLMPSGSAGPGEDSTPENRQDKYEAPLNAWYTGDLDQARALAEELVLADEQDAMAHAILGQVLDGDEESDSHLQRALSLCGNDTAVLSLVGDLYATRFGDYIFTDLSYLAPEARLEAERIYLRWAEAEPESPLPIQRLAWLEKTAGESQKAIGLLFVAIAMDPMEDVPHGDLWNLLGNGLNYEQLASFYEGLALSHEEADVKGRCFNYQGQVLIALGAWLRAEAAQALEQDDEAERINRLSEAQDAYQRAIPCLLKSAVVDPSLDQAARWYVADALVARAESFSDMGDLPAILLLLDEARQAVLAGAEPGTEGFKTLIERLSFAIFQASGGEGGSQEGMRTLADLWRFALDQVDDDVEWWNNYAFFCRESQQYEKSYEAYLHCLELDPENVRLINDAGLIQLYHLRADLDRALELFERAVALGEEQYAEAPDDEALEAELRSAYGDALLNLGRLRTERGEYDLAQAAFDRLFELDAERPDLLISQVELMLAIGDLVTIREFLHETALMLLTDPADRWPRFRLRVLGSALEASLSEEHPDQERQALVELIKRILDPRGAGEADRPEERERSQP